MTLVNKTPSATPFWRDKPYLFTAIAIFLGLGLCIASLLQVCTKYCAEAHEYRFYGMLFEPFGIGFFVTIGVLHLLSRRYSILSTAVFWMFMGGLGAEIMLTIIQKYTIGHWCPLCLAIGCAMALGALGSFYRYQQNLYQQIKQGNKRLAIKQIAVGLLTIPILCAGSGLIFFGVSKPVQESTYIPTAFGDTSSVVEIYIFTDWLCPSCKKIEKQMEDLYPKVAKKASLRFIDRPIHAESSNFIPYNLSLMRYHPEHYFEVRRALHALADSDTTPSLAQVQEAVKPLGITYEQMDYTDIKHAIEYYNGLSKTFNIDRTPMIILVNKQKPKQIIKLSGAHQIAHADLLALIDDLRGKENKEK